MIKKFKIILALLLTISLGSLGSHSPINDTISQPDHKATYRIENDEGIIYLQGKIDEDSADQVHAAFEQFKNSNITHVIIHIHSLGGYIQPGLDIVSDMLTARKHHVYVATLVDHGEYCASTCTVIFAAGASRIAAPDTFWLFHAVKVKNDFFGTEDDSDEARKEASDYEVAMVKIYSLADKKWANEVLKKYVLNPEKGDLVLSGREIMKQSDNWITFPIMDGKGA